MSPELSATSVSLIPHTPTGVAPLMLTAACVIGISRPDSAYEGMRVVCTVIQLLVFRVVCVSVHAR